MYSTVVNYDTGGVKCEQMRAGSQSLWNPGISARLPMSKSAALFRPETRVRRYRIGTDDGGLGQALSSDSRMDAVDWLAGVNLSPAYREGPHACVDKSPGESPEPASRRPGNYCFSPFGCPVRGRHKDRYLDWKHSECNKIVPESNISSLICVKMLHFSHTAY